MDINKYFQLGYEWLTKLVADALKELRKDKTEILRVIDKNSNEVVSNAEINSKAQIDAIQGLKQAIEEKEITESVEITNPEDLQNLVVNKLEEVINVFKTEISGIDKEITVKNDLSALTALFRSGADKKELLKALKDIEKKIKTPEITDYTLILNDLTTAVENIVIPEVSTKKIETLLEECNKMMMAEKPIIPEELIENDRIRVVLPDKQVERMAQQMVAVSGGGGSSVDVSGLATEETLSNIENVLTDKTITGSLTSLNSIVQLDIHGMGSCLAQVSGTWSGKIEFQGAIDGVWNTLSIFQPTGAITRNGIQNDNQNGLYRVVITSGYTKVRAIMTSYTSGSATILFNASAPVGSSQVWQLNQANLLVTAHQGGNWNVGITGDVATETTLQKVAGMNYDNVSVDTSNPTSIVITKKMGSTVIDTKTINII